MKRRVIELVSGQVVRDERSGGYQTQSVPVQNFNLTGSLVASNMAAAQPPARETRAVPEAAVPEATVPEATVPERDAALATGAIEVPVAPQRVVAAPAPQRAPQPVTPGSPPPLNEPGRRA
jgi:cell division transport system ATP-binding protein